MNAVQLMIAVKLMKEMARRQKGGIHETGRTSRPAAPPNHVRRRRHRSSKA